MSTEIYQSPKRKRGEQLYCRVKKKPHSSQANQNPIRKYFHLLILFAVFLLTQSHVRAASQEFIDSLIEADRAKTAWKKYGKKETTYSYYEIKDLQDYYDEHKPDSLLAGLDTSSFSRLLHENDPIGDYSQGFESGIFKDMSNQIYRGIRSLGIPKAELYVGVVIVILIGIFLIGCVWAFRKFTKINK